MKFIKRINVFKNTLNRTIILTIIIGILIIILLSRMLYMSYEHYRDTIITQQQQHLLTIAKSISRTLEMFIDEKKDSLRIIANNPEFQEKFNSFSESSDFKTDINTLKAFYEVQKKDIEAISLLDDKGNVIFQYPYNNKNKTNIKMFDKLDVDYVLKKHQSYIGHVYKSKFGYFLINILEPVFYKGQFKGILISSINLNTLYEYLVKPVKTGEKGYAMVKDKNGIILMHPVKE